MRVVTARFNAEFPHWNVPSQNKKTEKNNKVNERRRHYKDLFWRVKNLIHKYIEYYEEIPKRAAATGCSGVFGIVTALVAEL